MNDDPKCPICGTTFYGNFGPRERTGQKDGPPDIICIICWKCESVIYADMHTETLHHVPDLNLSDDQLAAVNRIREKLRKEPRP